MEDFIKVIIKLSIEQRIELENYMIDLLNAHNQKNVSLLICRRRQVQAA